MRNSAGNEPLLNQYEKLLKNLESLFQSKNEEIKEEISGQQIEYVKEELLRLTYEFAFERMEKILNEVGHYQLAPVDKLLFNELKRLLMDFEIEKIRDRLTK